MTPSRAPVAARNLAAVSIAVTGLTWLGVLGVHLSHATWPRDLAVLLLALAALNFAVLAVVLGVRNSLAWLALTVSLIFPVWLWHVLSRLPSDAF